MPFREASGRVLFVIIYSLGLFFVAILRSTAWSSAREPTQVFRLLETIYFHFDDLAKQRKVFKVETVGDW